MSRYATLSELSAMGQRLMNEDRQALAKADSNLVTTATFLSYSSADERSYVAGAMALLKRHGASVYMDRKDKDLPPTTSRATAEILRSRIMQTARFVLFATIKSKGSRWMPWELGIADGYKSPRCVAVFPGVENTSNDAWAEQEYLGIYDRIVRGKFSGSENEVWMVKNQEKNTAQELGEWLAN